MLFFKTPSPALLFGNNDILCEQNVDMQFGEKHLIYRQLFVRTA